MTIANPKTDADRAHEAADIVDDVENGPIQNPLGVQMAPDQRIRMLVTAAREVVKEAEAEDVDLVKLMERIKSQAAVLKQFEDMK